MELPGLKTHTTPTAGWLTGWKPPSHSSVYLYINPNTSRTAAAPMAGMEALFSVYRIWRGAACRCSHQSDPDRARRCFQTTDWVHIGKYVDLSTTSPFRSQVARIYRHFLGSASFNSQGVIRTSPERIWLSVGSGIVHGSGLENFTAFPEQRPWVDNMLFTCP